MAEPRPNRRKHKTEPPLLTLHEVRFAQLWFERHGNATQAFVDAEFPHSSRHAAEVAAFKLMRKPEIRAYIRELQAEAADVAKLTVNKIARGLGREAFADRTQIFGPDGEMLPPGEWPEEIRALVAGVTVDELTEFQPDPDNPRRKKKVAIGLTWKVRFVKSTEAKRILATWRGMIGGNKNPGSETAADPMVVGGEADPSNL